MQPSSKAPWHYKKAYTPGGLQLSDQHSPFFLHFIIDILARIYNVEAGGEFTCSLSQNTTLTEKTEENQSGGLVSGE